MDEHTIIRIVPWRLGCEISLLSTTVRAGQEHIRTIVSCRACDGISYSFVFDVKVGVSRCPREYINTHTMDREAIYIPTTIEKPDEWHVYHESTVYRS